MKWKKVRGGYAFQYIGWCADLHEATLGISDRRAAWLVNWLEGLIIGGQGTGGRPLPGGVGQGSDKPQPSSQAQRSDPGVASEGRGLHAGPRCRRP